MTDVQTSPYITGQRRRIAERWKIHIPPKPDRDVLALCQEYFMPYGRARMLKALSFGIFVNHRILAWCCSLPPGPDDYHRHEVSHQVYEIKQAVGHLPVVHTYGLGYCIHDEAALARIRAVMA